MPFLSKPPVDHLQNRHGQLFDKLCAVECVKLYCLYPVCPHDVMYSHWNSFTFTTKYNDCVVNTPASYSRGSGLKSWPKVQLS